MHTQPELAEVPHAEDAFARFVRRHQAPVWRYLRLMGADSQEADDLLQETFLRVPFDATLPTPGTLRTIARNLLVDHRRAARRRSPAQAFCDAVDELVATDPEMLSDARLAALRDCVARLHGRARAAVEGHYFDGLDYGALAATLGMRRNGVRTLLARTRRVLRACIEREVAE